MQQGSGNDHYFLAALSAVAMYPNKIKDLFVTDEIIKDGIIGVKLYVRGKPWVISLDEWFLWKYPNNPTLVFAKSYQDATGIALWPVILEKAWAKVNGFYGNLAGGFVQSGLRALTGVPVISYDG